MAQMDRLLTERPGHLRSCAGFGTGQAARAVQMVRNE